MNLKNTKILYVIPYSENVFGAEEQDLYAGIDILKYHKHVEIFVLKVNLKSKSLIGDLNICTNYYRLTWIDKIKFFMIKYTTLDHAMTQAFTYKNYQIILKLLQEYRIDLIITNTTSCVLFGLQSYSKHVFRSVSFEPIYTLKTVENKIKAMLHSMIKLLSVHKELMANTILSISPRDLSYYRYISLFLKKKIILMPLRQFFHLISETDKLVYNPKLSIAFLGSTYNVLHNRKSYEFIIQKIPNTFWYKNSIFLNIYGRKITMIDSKIDNIVIHHWIENIEDIYFKNEIFLVPYYLSAGMQSKVFEPLIRGKILICDPRVLAGYSFISGIHYISATSPEDFMSAILWVKSNFRSAAKIANQAAKHSQEIISREFILNQTSTLLSSYRL